MQAFLNKLIYRNLPETSIRDKKTAVLCNKVLLLSMTGSTCVSFAALLDHFMSVENKILGFILNIIFPVLYFSLLRINHSGKFALGKLLFIFVGNLHITISVLAFGPESRADVYFLISFILPLLLFTKQQRNKIFFSASLSLVFYLLTSLYLIENTPFLKPPNEAIPFWRLCNSIVIAMILIGSVYNFFVATHEAEELFQEEYRRSEELLLNILPASIAKRLKAGEKVIAEQYDNVTVLFADIVGFTQYSKTVSPQQLVNVLNELFIEFDSLTSKYSLEKIKTIGDAYMVVCGIPEKQEQHAQQILEMALEMRTVLSTWRNKMRVDLELRIGIHSGSVIAGVIGRKKFVYDTWGDTVNTASRMESHSETGQIHVSQTSYELLKEQYKFIDRGNISIKSIGNMHTYYVKQ